MKYKLCWLVLAWLLSACTATGPDITPTSIAPVVRDQTPVVTSTPSLAPPSKAPTVLLTISETLRMEHLLRFLLRIWYWVYIT